MRDKRFLKLSDIRHFFPFWTDSSIRKHTRSGLIPSRRIGGTHYYNEAEMRRVSAKLLKGGEK